MARPNDLNSYWMPYTANRAFKSDPRMIVSADGMHYRSDDGRDILDATAGLWCVNAGHNRPKITEAVQRQVAELDYAPSFQFGHPKAFELANRVVEMFPDGMNQVFFTNSGSEAVDSALKIALAYQRARGKGGKTRLIGRERGYHGTGFGGISVGGIVANRKQFGPLLPGVDHLRHTHDLARNAYTRGLPEHGAELADDLERLVQLHDASTIAAVIVEPMAGSTGVLLPPKGYLQRLRALCDKHDILLIFDEVITAFGRLGAATGSEYFGVTPDLITCAKGITNGIIPLGAVVVQEWIYQTMLDAAEAPIELFHGYTYSGHPIAVAAGLATLDTYREEGLFERAAALGPLIEDGVHSLKGERNVIDIRNLGAVAAVELAPREGAPGARAFEAMKLAWDRGVMIRVAGDVIAYSPPFIATHAHVEQMFEVTREVLALVE
jgi:beta-alanine--pyruvate transaminase